MALFTAPAGNGSQRELNIFRGEAIDGEPVYETVEPDTYVVPPTGTYHLRVTGFTKFYDEASQFAENLGQMITKTDVELEIASGRGAGRRFMWRFLRVSTHEKSKLGPLFTAATQGRQAVGIEDMIGGEVDAYVQASDKQNDLGQPSFAFLLKDSIKPHKAGGQTEYDPFADGGTVDFKKLTTVS